MFRFRVRPWFRPKAMFWSALLFFFLWLSILVTRVLFPCVRGRGAREGGRAFSGEINQVTVSFVLLSFWVQCKSNVYSTGAACRGLSRSTRAQRVAARRGCRFMSSIAAAVDGSRCVDTDARHRFCGRRLFWYVCFVAFFPLFPFCRPPRRRRSTSWRSSRTVAWQ